MLGFLATIGALVQAVPAFGWEDPEEGPFHHQLITEDAARRAGWNTGDANADDAPNSDSATAALAWHTDYVDSYLYNPLWWVGGGLRRFKAALLSHDELVKVHFDDLTTFRQIALSWDRYLGGTVAGLVWAAEFDDVPAARHLTGVGLHAAQDFYSHSNWVDDRIRRHRTWFEYRSMEEPHLYTGAYEMSHLLAFKRHGKPALDCSIMRNLIGEDFMEIVCQGISPFSNSSMCRRWQECKGAVPGDPSGVAGVPLPANVYMVETGIALDSNWQAAIAVRDRDLDDPIKAVDLFNTARGLAMHHTYQWLMSLERLMNNLGHGAFWRHVMSDRRDGQSGYGPDIDQYEDASRLLYTFLSAGLYPPPVDGSAEGWFFRLELETSTEPEAGSDADIYAEVGGISYLLDHMHGQNRVLAFNDFERGDRTAYVIGPFPSLPTELTLRNSAADLLGVLAAAWHDLVDWVDQVLTGIGHFLLSLIGGHADFVASDKRAWSWSDLQAIRAGSAGNAFELNCEGGGEGHFRVSGHLELAGSDDELEVAVVFDSLYCVRESGIDAQFTGADETFVLLLANSPALQQLDEQIRTDIGGVYLDVDTGERRDMWQVLRVRVPRYGGLIVPVAVYESDAEGAAGRETLKEEFANRYGADTVNQRSRFLDALGSAISPDWRPATISVFAFRRGQVVETAWLARRVTIDRWVEAGEQLTIPLVAAGARAIPLPRPVLNVAPMITLLV